MVSLSQIQSSNARISSDLPAGLVAVFVGGTGAIGETTMKSFAKHAVSPRIYFIGWSKEAATRIQSDLEAVNPAGEYHFIAADVSLLRSVDDACREIKAKERAVNLVHLTSGTVAAGKDTTEGLRYQSAVAYYSRIRFIVNLLPLLQRAPALRRVLTVFGGTKEGSLDVNDLDSRRVPLGKLRGHLSSTVTLALESLAFEAPNVSFVHAFPGSVRSKSGVQRGRRVSSSNGNNSKAMPGAIYGALHSLFAVPPLLGLGGGTMPFTEAGERQLFVATSARFPARYHHHHKSSSSSSSSPVLGSGDASPGPVNTHNNNTTVGVSCPRGVPIARGTDARGGTGVYSVSYDAETAPHKVDELLQGLRDRDVVRKLWLHTEEEFVRATGSAFV
ncbi:hypothetical protein B0T24DRAFT_660550 [Lasiosphaeria ovina]|uniref:Uncharacterized protein n=1 Tax=Lasiosphaeria ovina TaxID=92902 RepID=A0AAE0JSV3_9PEZI|nr:hypothetical protein B0T24DRAFT_660550 [Lasiosphaeria ovina]